MTSNVAIRILLVLLASAGVAATQQGGQYSVGGVVVNSRTGEPVNRALVWLLDFNAPKSPAAGDSRGGQKTPRRVARVIGSAFTDAAGAFRFSALAPGEYGVSAQKPGFTPMQSESSTGDPGRVNLTSSIEGIRLNLSPLGAIAGKVVDGDGLPLRGVNVLARSLRIVDGMKQTNADRTVTTDDRGLYRVWNLMPGRYYIHAAGRSGGTYLYAGDSAPQYNANRAFMPRYFGGGGNLESAAPVVIEAGTEATADVALTLEPAYRIRGSLANFVPRRTVKFELFAGDEDVSASRVSVNGDSGRFEIQDVAAGSYVLRATQGDTIAEVPVSVNGQDLDGIVAQLMSGVDIGVVSRFINVPPPDPDNEFADRYVFCTVQLYPSRRTGRSYVMQNHRNQESVDLLLVGVLPGAYRADVQCLGGYVTFAMYGS